MQIEEQDFKLSQVSDSSPFWDLELLYVVKPRGGEPRQEFKQSGYGLTLESAMKRIVNYRISSKHKEESLSMKDYLKEYKEILENI